MPMIGPVFQNAATILTEIYKGVTGHDLVNPIINTADYVSVAETTLRTGFDPIMGAISQILSRTVFATRPYNARLIGLQQDREEYGNHVRKISYEDQDPQADPSYSLVNGQSVDQQVVQKPKVLQTNLYGIASYCRQMTRFDAQIKNALMDPEELMRFWEGMVTHMSNQIETDALALRLNLIANWATGKTATDATGVIYLLDEYNAQTGQSLTTTSVYAPANFPDFARFAYARIMDVSNLMRDRSVYWHQTFTGHENLLRHTPYGMQNLYLSSFSQYQIDARVLSDTFNADMTRYRNYELVPFWQINSPDADDRMKIQATPNITLGATGAASQWKAVGLSNVFGMILDRDAAGYTVVDTSIDPSPYNGRGRYRNTWYHYAFRYWNDFTENGALFLLTSADVTSPSAAANVLTGLDAVDSTGDAAEDAATLKAAKASAAKTVAKMDAEAAAK